MTEQFRLCLAFYRSVACTRTEERSKILAAGLIAFAVFSSSSGRVAAQMPTPVSVPTWRYDVTHQGQNTHETALTPANVNGNTFGKRFSVTVDSTPSMPSFSTCPDS